MMIKNWSTIVVVFAALVMGSLSSAAWVSQEPDRSPISEEERRRVLERLMKQLQDAQQNVKQPPVAAPQQITPAQPAAPAPAPAPATSIVQRESGKMQLNTENAELYDFITQMASTLGLTPIVIDPDIKGSVNIMSTAPLSKDDVQPLFNLILKNNGAALIKQGDIYQIVPTSSALKKGVDIIEHLPPPDTKPEPEKTPAKKPNDAPQTGTEPPNPPASSAAATSAAISAAAATQAAPKAAQAPDSGTSKTPRLATHVIRVEFVPVKDLVEPLKLFMTEGGVIMPYERLNMLILTDYSDSAARVMQIIHMLDNSFLDPELIDLIKINNNASADVLDDLKKIFGSGGKDSATGVSFVSLDRMNAIFVIASSKRALEEAKRWIKQLDATTGRNIQTYVYIVENSTASNIGMMISALYGGEGSTPSGGTGGAGVSGGAAGGGLGGRSSQTGGLGGGAFGGSGSSFGGAGSQGTTTSGLFGGTSSYQSGGSFGGNQSGYQGGYMGGSAFGAGQQLGPRLNANPTISSQVLRGGAFTGLQDTVRMVVDDVNNSLIFQATAADYAFILDTIKKMDVLPRQAIIDARIFEIDLDDSLSFGISGILQARTSGSHVTTGNMNTGSGDTLTGISAQTYAFIGDSQEILASLNALRTKTKLRILEAPSVLALDGTIAHIVVGGEYPYPTGSYTPAVGGATTNVQYRDTGISLIVMPRISASGSVTLQIEQEVSSPGSSVNNAPTFNKTNIETTLSVKDGETVAIAGLIRDSNNFARSGVPFLSQIPLLGSLFGTTTKNVHRTELIILITPHVIRTPERFQEMTQELKDSLRHARKLVDQKEDEHIRDMQDAREERAKREEKQLKKAEPSKQEAQPAQPSTQPGLPPKDKQAD